MGLDLFESGGQVGRLFHDADEILGFGLSEIMFHGTEADLKQTKVTQPAVFLHSVAVARSLGERFRPDMVAGHSLGEFSALVAAGALSFEDGLKLVSARAQAMQKACEAADSAMAAVIGLPDEVVEKVCEQIPGLVVPANYNCPGQVVISGYADAIARACDALKEAGAKRALPLQVGGAFHSPVMEPARQELAQAIEAACISTPVCPVYQNVDALPHTDSSEIKANLLAQLTAPVLWTRSVGNMISDGLTEFEECGPGRVLTGLMARINKTIRND